LGAALLIFGVTLAGASAPGRETGEAQKVTSETPPGKIVISGKLFCSLRQQVPLPFPGQITGLKVRPGQGVEAGEILAQYRLAPEALVQIRRRLTPPRIREAEIQLAEIEKNLHEAKGKLRGLQQLAREDLASAQALKQVKDQRQFLLKQQQAVMEGLEAERRLAKTDLAVLQKQVGRSINVHNLSEEASLISPMKGHVTWINPEFKEGALLSPTPVVFVVGVLDPMIIRARVHEIEAMQLRLGEKASVSVESLPNRQFEARVTRFNWTSSSLELEQPAYFDVEFQLANQDLILKEGLKVQVVLAR